jgi:hypothetical protein
MYFHTDTIYFPELPYKVGGNLHPPHKPVIRYLHVRIKDKEIVNIYDNVKISGTGKYGNNLLVFGISDSRVLSRKYRKLFLDSDSRWEDSSIPSQEFCDKQGHCFVLSHNIVLAQ